MKKDKNADSTNSMTFKNKVDNFFGITKNGSSFKVETIGGLTTFFAMMYIILINPNYTLGFSADAKLKGAVYIATALGAMIGTLLYAFYAKMPFAQAPGMGLNSFFFVSFMVVALDKDFTTQATQFSKGLTVIFLSGIIFMIISATGLRKKISEAMPENLKKAIPAGIGLFIAFIGFKNSNFIVDNKYTLVQLVNLNFVNLNDKTAGELWYQSLAPFIIMLLALSALAVMGKKKIKGSVIYTILGSTCLYYLFNIGNAAAFDYVSKTFKDFLPSQTFKNFGQYAVGQAFMGFKDVFVDSALNKVTFSSVMTVIMLVVTFLLVDMFDTLGTLQGAATESGMLDEKGLPIRLKQCLMSDSIGTLSGSILGVSSVTTYVESSAGIAAGARTGFASLVTACGFFIAMFFSPIAAVIPGVATAPILVYVGVLMLKNFKSVDMSDLSEAIPAFLTLIMMPLTYSISNGIAIGLISYTLIKLVTFKFTKKDIIPAIIAILFIIRFLTVSM